MTARPCAIPAAVAVSLVLACPALTQESRPASRAATTDATPTTKPADLTGDQIIDRYLAVQDVDSELAFIKMVQSAPGAEKKESRFLVVYQRAANGTRSYMLRLLRPRDVMGVSLVAVERADHAVDQFVYLPAIGKAKQLTGASAQGAFLGSDYSYEDLLREIPDTQVYERLEDSSYQDSECFVIRAREKDASAAGPVEATSGETGDRRPARRSAYAWRDLYIDQKTFQISKVHFHDRRGKRIKVLVAYDYGHEEIVGSTTRPRRAVMTNSETGTWTDFTVIEGRLHEEFPADLFTPKKMETWTELEVEDFIFKLGITAK